MSLSSLISSMAARIEQLTKSVEQSAANHNALVGALTEAKNVLDVAQTLNLPGSTGALISALDGAANMAESIAQTVEEPAPITTPSGNN